MILTAAGMWYLGVRSIRALALPESVEQLLVGIVSIGCIIATALLGRQFLRAYGARGA
jgi:hypothetical protein